MPISSLLVATANYGKRPQSDSYALLYEQDK